MGRFTSPPTRAAAALKKADTPSETGLTKILIPNPFPPEDDDRDPDADIEQEISSGREQLRALSHQLLVATKPAEMDEIGLNIQRLRVHLMLLNEAQTGKSDPDLQREMKLLRQMIADRGEQDEDEPEDPAQVARYESAKERLDRDGIDQGRAGRMLRIATSLNRRALDTPEPAAHGE